MSRIENCISLAISFLPKERTQWSTFEVGTDTWGDGLEQKETWVSSKDSRAVIEDVTHLYEDKPLGEIAVDQKKELEKQKLIDELSELKIR